jgi:periplasmic protein CpxP/Spy
VVDETVYRERVPMRIFIPSAVLGAVLVSGFTGSALFAQDQAQPPTAAPQAQTAPQPHRAPDPQRQTKRMAKKLSLTADQQAKIEPILADRDQQMQSLRANTALAASDRKAQFRSVVQDSDSKIEAVLTDTQKAQYEQMKQSRRTKHQQAQSAPANS